MRLFIAIICSLLTTHTAANPALTLASFIDAHTHDRRIGVLVMRAHTGEVVYRHDADALFQPASLTKIFTAVSTWLGMDPADTFTTSVSANTPVQPDGRLEHLYLTFRGSPTLSHRDIDDFFRTLATQSLQEIAGDIIIDDHRFEGPGVAMGTVEDDTYWYFGAPAATIVLDQNTLPVTFHANGADASPMRITPDPNYDWAWSNLNTTVEIAPPEVANTACQLVFEPAPEHHLHLSGCWPRSAQPVQVRLAIRAPRMAIQQKIQQALETHQITLRGRIRFDTVPDMAHTLITHHSPPIQTVMQHMLKTSDNLSANILFKALGYQYFGRGHFQSGGMAQQRVLSEKLGYHSDALPLPDGSGLSILGLLSPTDIGQLLYHAFHHDGLYADLREALPHPGTFGSLETRFHTFTPETLAAKTGLMTGVSALAGYLGPSSDPLIFVLMQDRTRLSTPQLKAFEETCLPLIQQLTS